MRVHIERLVLDGFVAGPGAAERWRAAVEQELARALAAEGVAAPVGPVVLDLRDPARAAAPVADAVAAHLRSGPAITSSGARSPGQNGRRGVAR